MSMFRPEWCPTCKKDTDTRDITIKGNWDSDGVQVDPDESEFYCQECGEEK